MSKIKAGNDSNLGELVGEGFVIVDFFASWCHPCRIMAPILEELADELADVVTIVKVDADKSKEATDRHGIRGLPTLKLFKHGQLVNTLVGVQSLEKLKSEVKKYNG